MITKFDSNINKTQGVLNINKPKDLTSMDIVRTIKRVTGVRKIGHAGTLDPLATGVLPICLGQATRIMEDILNKKKIYRTNIHFGVTTNTYDLEGEILSNKDVNNTIDCNTIKSEITKFIGEIDQIPPMYSALRIKGQRLYELARKGIILDLKPRKVKVYSIKILKWNSPFLTLDIACGKGFYVRSFAHDLGEVLGCGAHINSLTRLQNGIFSLESSINIEQFKDRVENDNWTNLLYSIDTVLDDLPKITVQYDVEKIIKNGNILPDNIYENNVPDGTKCKVYNLEGKFIGLIIFHEDLNKWTSYKNFN